jgi:hypothetical protein
MPYEVIRLGNRFAVKTKATGKLHGFSSSLPKAQGQLRVLEAAVKKGGK